MVLGVRGMPNVQGGVETHAERLYEQLAGMGCSIDVIVRSPFVTPEHKTLGTIRLHRIWAPRQAGLEAFVHSFLGVLYAAVKRPDILHIHAIGPAIVTPLARLLGLRVVVTHHGPDYDRDKWGMVARWVLQTGERVGMQRSHARIVISKVIADLVRNKYRVESDLIPNGVIPPVVRGGDDHVRELGLEPGKYVLQVSRLVPEKRQTDLIAAFELAQPAGWKLAVVGGLDGSAYGKEVQQLAARSDKVVLAGFRNGQALEQLYANAGLFVLPSSHEGLPIAMLEALSYGLRVVASDIPANLEVGLDAANYFRMGDIESLAERLRQFTTAVQPAEDRARLKELVRVRYDWRTIAASTLAVYRHVVTDM